MAPDSSQAIVFPKSFKWQAWWSWESRKLLEDICLLWGKIYTRDELLWIGKRSWWMLKAPCSCCCLVAHHVQLFVTPWTIACQAPRSMGFPRQEYWSGFPFSSPKDLPHPGIKPASPALQVDSLPVSHQGSQKSPWEDPYFSCSQVPARESNGTPLQYSCLKNPMDGGAWKAAVHGVTEGRTRLSDFTFTFHFHALEKETAAHSSVLVWRIPGMGEPGGLPSMGLHRVRYDWSDLATASPSQIPDFPVIYLYKLQLNSVNQQTPILS